MLPRGSREPAFWRRTGPVVFLTVIFFVNFASRIVFAPFLPTIEKDLGISHSGAGLFFFLIAVGYCVALLGSGFVSARLTHRRTIVVSCMGVGLSLIIMSVAGGLWEFRLGLLLLGFAAGLYIPSAIATITSLIDSSHWGKAIAIHELAPNFAFILVPVLGDFALRWSTWRAALGFFAAIAVIMSVAFARYGKGGEFAGESPASSSLRNLAAVPSFWLLTALFCFAVASTVGVFAMLPLYLIHERGMNQSWANTLVSLSRLSGPAMGFVGGWASDYLGPKTTIVVSLLITGVTTLLIGPAPDAWLPSLVVLQPALAVCFFPAGFAAISAIGPAASRNVAISFVVPLGFLVGAGSIPALIGFMGDTSSFATGLVLVGGLILSGALLALFLRLPEAKAAGAQVDMG
jgi:NNP family nitrate/nitrite transporter-like MFS transporter